MERVDGMCLAPLELTSSLALFAGGDAELRLHRSWFFLGDAVLVMGVGTCCGETPPVGSAQGIEGSV